MVLLQRLLASKLKEGWFSVNLDEATNNAMDKILNMMVKIYDDEKKSTVVAHFVSVDVNVATAQNMHQATASASQSKDVPMANVVSCCLTTVPQGEAVGWSSKPR